MDIITLKHEIMHEELNNFYVFIGVEIQVQREYIKKISEVNGKPIKYIDKVLDIYGKSNSLFVSQTYTYVCIEDRDFVSNEHGWDTVSKVLCGNTLILWYTSLDKRGKFYKHFTVPPFLDNIVEFEHMDEDVLFKYIKRNIDLSDRNCYLLMQYCEYDYARCLLEIDKIRHFISSDFDGNSRTHDEAFEELIDNGTIYRPVGDVIFDLSNAVIDRKYKRSIQLLHDYELSDDTPLRALTVLYNTFKKTLQVQSCKSDNISASTGLSDKEVYQVNKHVGKYSIGELVHAMKIIRKAEINFKQGMIDEDYLLPYVLMNVL